MIHSKYQSLNIKRRKTIQFGIQFHDSIWDWLKDWVVKVSEFQNSLGSIFPNFKILMNPTFLRNSRINCQEKYEKKSTKDNQSKKFFREL